MVHSWATTTDDPTVMPRWGKIGKQKIEDAGTLYPERMKTVDNEIRDLALTFIEKAKNDNKPFFCWLNPTRMHIVTHLSEKYEKMRDSGMAGPKKKPAWPDSVATSAWSCGTQGPCLDDNTIVVFTTEIGTELFAWPDGGTTPFAQSKGTVMEGGPHAMHRSLARPCSNGLGSERHLLRPRLVPNLPRCRPQPNVADHCSKV